VPSFFRVTTYFRNDWNITDLVGCFADPPQLSIKRPPEHPSVIQTRFFFHTRADRRNPESLQYGDNLRSIVHSRFNASKLVKVLIHGYKGSGSDIGVVLGADLLLDIVIFSSLLCYSFRFYNHIASKSIKLLISLKSHWTWHAGGRKRHYRRLDSRRRW